MTNVITLDQFTDDGKKILRKYGLKQMTDKKKRTPEFYICNRKKNRFIIVYKEEDYYYIDRDYDDCRYGERCYETWIDFLEDLKLYIKNNIKKDKK